MNQYNKYLIENLNQPSGSSDCKAILIESQETKLKLNIKVYLDDIRVPKQTYPESDTNEWTIVRNYEDFCKLVSSHGKSIDFISFDHDLAIEHLPISEFDGGLKNGNKIPYESYTEKTGYDCAKFLVDYCIETNTKLPKWKVHSMNPVGRKNIEGYLKNFEDAILVNGTNYFQS